MTNGKKIKISKNGPYLVSGNIPVGREDIIYDEGVPLKWKKAEEIKADKDCALCRCGHSKNKPFCDGNHIKVKFDGTETADNLPFDQQANVIDGPELILKDAGQYCIGAGFCDRGDGAWSLTEESNDLEAKKAAIEECTNCPSGRLVLVDKKTDKEIEPKLEQEISLVKDGPLWVKGGVPVEGAKGEKYEARNRVTLCRCGKSANKPFCDGTHYKIEFKD